MESFKNSFQHILGKTGDGGSTIDGHLKTLTSQTTATTNLLFERTSLVLSTSFKGMKGFFSKAPVN